jgi:chromate reductase
MSDPKLLTICGSLRAGSFNRKLLAEAVTQFGPADLSDANLRLPLFDGDLQAEHGIPDEVETLAQQIRDADGIIISSPEYNKGITGVLKNALDWISRVEGAVFKDKPVALMSAANGRSGGETAQYMTRACLIPLQPRLINGNFVLIAAASREFENGALENERYLANVQALMQSLRTEINRT